MPDLWGRVGGFGGGKAGGGRPKGGRPRGRGWRGVQRDCTQRLAKQDVRHWEGGVRGACSGSWSPTPRAPNQPAEGMLVHTAPALHRPCRRLPSTSTTSPSPIAPLTSPARTLPPPSLESGHSPDPPDPSLLSACSCPRACWPAAGLAGRAARPLRTAPLAPTLRRWRRDAGRLRGCCWWRRHSWACRGSRCVWGGSGGGRCSAVVRAAQPGPLSLIGVVEAGTLPPPPTCIYHEHPFVDAHAHTDTQPSLLVSPSPGGPPRRLH